MLKRIQPHYRQFVTSREPAGWSRVGSYSGFLLHRKNPQRAENFIEKNLFWLRFSKLSVNFSVVQKKNCVPNNKLFTSRILEMMTSLHVHSHEMQGSEGKPRLAISSSQMEDRFQRRSAEIQTIFSRLSNLLIADQALHEEERVKNIESQSVFNPFFTRVNSKFDHGRRGKCGKGREDDSQLQLGEGVTAATRATHLATVARSEIMMYSQRRNTGLKCNALP